MISGLFFLGFLLFGQDGPKSSILPGLKIFLRSFNAQSDHPRASWIYSPYTPYYTPGPCVDYVCRALCFESFHLPLDAPLDSDSGR